MQWLLEHLRECTQDMFPCVPVQIVQESCMTVENNLREFLANQPELDKESLLWCITRMLLHGMSHEEAFSMLGIPYPSTNPVVVVTPCHPNNGLEPDLKPAASNSAA